MYYYEREGDVIFKYKVNFDEEVLLEFREVVIINTSIISYLNEEENYEGSEKFSIQEDGRVYTFPTLVDLLDRLLEGDESALAKIINGDLTDERIIDAKATVQRQVDTSRAKLDSIDTLDIPEYDKIDLRINQLLDLAETYDLLKLNINQVPVVTYYKILQRLLRKELVDSISAEQVDNINAFFGGSSAVINRKQNIKRLENK